MSVRASSEFAPAVLVPTFNHGRTLPAVLDGLAALGMPIIVVDDGSTDGTGAALDAWAAANPGVPLHRLAHPRNRGKAAALHTGFAIAAELGCTHVATIDADGQLEPSDIPALLAVAAERPGALVLGRRPQVMAACPGRCVVGRRFANLAIRVQCGLRLADTQCGLRVYPLGLARGVRCAGGRYAFEAEIITRAAWAGHEVVEVPVRCSYFPGADRVSHFRPWRDSALQTVLHLRLASRALMPWTRSVVRFEDDAESRGMPAWRRGLRWLNPARALRDARISDLGRLELAFAVGVGAFIGCLPFFGLHTGISIYAAWRLHLHPAAVVLGSQVSIPPMGVALAAVSVWIGHLAMTGRALRIADLDPEWASLPWFAAHWLPAWMIGSLIVGLFAGMAAFGVVLTLSGRPAKQRVPAADPAR